MAYSEQEILTRAVFLKQVALDARNAIEKALRAHENLSGKPLQSVMDEIRLSDDKLVDASRLYYILLDKYKIKHDYYSHDKLVGRDKVASLTSFAILKTEPFEIVNITSDGKHVSTLPTRLANEIFAMLFSLVVIKAPPKAIPPILYLSYLHNMGSLNELLHEYEIAVRGRTSRVNCTLEWMICAFKCLGLKYGNLDIRIDDGD